MIDVLALGDIVLDLIVPIEYLPIKDEDVQIAKYIRREAGGVCNFLIAASRLGLKVGIVGCVGDDEDGRFVIESLRREGVDVAGIDEIEERETAKVLVLVDGKGRHAFIGVHGIGIEVYQDRMDAKRIESSRAIFTSGHTLIRYPSLDATLEVMRKAKGLGIPVFFDPGPLVNKIQPKVLDSALESTEVLMSNISEAKALAGTQDLKITSEILLKKGVKTVVIKLGRGGCFIAQEGSSIHIPGFKVPVVDTTGAGDSFNAAYVYGYLRQLPINYLGILANAVGGIMVTKLGGGTQAPSKKELVDFLKEYKVTNIIKKLLAYLEG
ncbi:MAG: carbohydrate kinase family protein [Candidatus Methylarchaceae archaeon HK02M1]|nr:carbohydrate kinase family protein [Candidatus Methylarchaceae archaeon HK02M1]